jgi:NAD(P)-dependent dehydrogenase (short-subunit alcohol dehydrogenase family)
MGALDGRVGIVTGGAGNLGSHISTLFASEGGIVVINDVNEERADAVAEKIRASGQQATVAVADATTYQSAKALVDGVVAEHGRVDVAILAGANLAGMRYESIDDMSEEHFREIALSHAGGHFAMIKAVIPHMKKQRYGRIVGFASCTGMVADWGFSHYAAGKGGVTSLVRTAAIELDPWGITVNAVSPAGTPGPGNTTPVLRERTGDSAGVAPATVYLGTEAAGYINGHIFEVSGSGRIGVYPPFVPERYVHNPNGWTVAHVAQFMPGLFEVSWTNEPRQRPSLLSRDPLLEGHPGEMVDHLPTGLSPIVSDALTNSGYLDAMGVPGYNQPGPKVTPEG